MREALSCTMAALLLWGTSTAAAEQGGADRTEARIQEILRKRRLDLSPREVEERIRARLARHEGRARGETPPPPIDRPPSPAESPGPPAGPSPRPVRTPPPYGPPARGQATEPRPAGRATASTLPSPARPARAAVPAATGRHEPPAAHPGQEVDDPQAGHGPHSATFLNRMDADVHVKVVRADAGSTRRVLGHLHLGPGRSGTLRLPDGRFHNLFKIAPRGQEPHFSHSTTAYTLQASEDEHIEATFIVDESDPSSGMVVGADAADHEGRPAR